MDLIERKPQSLRELAAIAEQYLTAHNKKLSSRNFNAKKNVGTSRQEGKISDVFPATTKSIKYFSCGSWRHKARECFLRMQDKRRKRYCYRCGGIGHTFMQCEREHQLAHGGAGARERAYKVVCDMPIRKFSAAENGRRKEENCKSLSKERKELGQKSQEYLELKDGRKIEILNGAYMYVYRRKFK